MAPDATRKEIIYCKSISVYILRKYKGKAKEMFDLVHHIRIQTHEESAVNAQADKQEVIC